MKKKALVIGAGPAGCTSAWALTQKGFEVTVAEKTWGVGGLSKTSFYQGHPFEFGPHVWFWPKDRENRLVSDLSEEGFHNIDRKLYTFTSAGLYRYPIHFSDIANMPGAGEILHQVFINRDLDGKLRYSRLPKIGECKFDEYFKATIGPRLYELFMEEYTEKMWGIPGKELETTMVWADRLTKEGVGFEYDPLKFDEQHNLCKDLNNWYPKSAKGWNVIWENMLKGSTVVFGKTVDCMTDLSSYDVVIVTISPDSFLCKEVLPAMGRIVIPLLVPGKERVYPNGIESIHYADNSPATRTTEMKSITKYVSPDSLLLIEVPVYSGTDPLTPNVTVPEYYSARCYPEQTKSVLEQHALLTAEAKSLSPNIHFTGRMAKWKYWGMAETVEDALNTVEKVV